MTLGFSDVETLAWDKGDGLLPAIVQHAHDGSVLMQAFMNRDALRATLERRRVVFFSRSRQQLWEKGETSGHTLSLVDVRSDCDNDSLLISALPAGPTCHTGARTCFGDAPQSDAEQIAFLGELQRIIADRIATAPEGSYTARLFNEGVRRMAQKVGEEGLEVALAAVGESDEALLGECADLVFHLLLLLRGRSLSLEQVVAELHGRHLPRT
jgi:phosphoribosyl-ATP pyrophosphohydrolase/phosphoribosyl-AMP cyclohydrolase